MSIQYTKTQNTIRTLLPGDEHKATRHALYTLIHGFHVGKVPPGTTVQNYQYPEHVDSVILDQIAVALSEERCNCRELSGLVMDTINGMCDFTAHDITRKVRDMVNNSAIQLLDDRPFEEVEIVEGAGPALTQRIEHSEVKDILSELVIKGELSRQFDKNVKAFRYSQKSCNSCADDVTPSAVPTDSLLARLWAPSGK